MWQELWRSTATGKQTQPLQASLNVSASTLSASIVGMRWSLLMWHKDMQCYHHNAGTQCSQMSGTTSKQRRGHLKHPSQNKRIRIPVMIQSQSSEGSKKQNTGIKKNNIFPTEMYFNGGLDILFWSIFFDHATGGSKCSSSPLEGIKQKMFQTEIDFDAGSRLPLGAAIQNMNPFRVGLRFIDGCFRVYLV